MDDTCAQNSKKKEDNVIGSTDENEWDRPFHLRWEKCQSKEEEALGQGKRQRKVVSHREAYTSPANEGLQEIGA